MDRPALLVGTLLLAACSSATDLSTPSAPSVTGTVTYTAGGSLQVSSNQGYWLSTGVAQVTIVGLTTSPGQPDSLHPAFSGLQMILAGPQFSAFPTDASITVGTTDGASLGVWVMSGLAHFAYAADSGRATVRRLGGGYVQVSVTIWCAPLNFSGTLEVPEQTT